MTKRTRLYSLLVALILTLSLLLSGCEGILPPIGGNNGLGGGETNAPISLDEIPPHTTAAYVAINGNVPYFTDDEITSRAFERYSELDTLGRCGVALASVGKELMPTDDRESISEVTPSGWKYQGTSNNNRYDFVDNGYVYNRCHLIGFQLTGENANEKNLITGTRYLNIRGMLPFEDMVADYVKETGNHVMYRVTPIYGEYDLVASGVLIEGYSVEDEGDGICFCVCAYNVQPGVEINYRNGVNRKSGDTSVDLEEPNIPSVRTYVINTKTKKYHLESCHHATNISTENREVFTGEKEELLELYADYVPCATCDP